MVRNIYLRTTTTNHKYQVQNILLFTEGLMPKKHRLGPQNGFGSSGPEKLRKIVNCATIKETEKN